jgi:stage V sporulation protein B
MRSLQKMAENELSLRDVMLKASVTMMALMIFAKTLGYAFHFLFVRFFARQDYGSFVFLWSLGLFICGLMPNISASIARYVAFYRGGSDEAGVRQTIRTGLVLNSVIVALYVAAVCILYFSGIYSFGIVGVIALIFVLSTIVLTSYNNLFAGIVTGYRRPEVSTFFLLVQNLLRTVAIAAGVLLAASFGGILLLTSLAFLFATLLLMSYAIREFGLGFGYGGRSAAELFGFGIFNVVHVTANNILTWSSVFIIQYFLGSAVLAVYNVSSLASTVSLLFFTATLQIFSPLAAEMFGARKLDRLSHLTSYMFESFFLMFLPMFLSVTVFARELLVLFVKSEYSQGALPLQILSIGAFFFGIAMLFIELINAEGKPQINARNIGFGAVLNAGLNWFLIPQYGMVGAASATLVSSAVILILSFSHIQKVVRLSYSRIRVAKLIGSSVAGVLAAFFLKTQINSPLLSLAVCSVALLGVYSVMLIVLRALRSDDVGLASAVMERLKLPTSIKDGVSTILGFGVSP